MDFNFLNYFFWTANFLFLFYGATLILLYFSGVFLASKSVERNRKKAHFLNVKDIVSATDVPSVTLVAPAYNEGLTIVDNVKSLLSLHYPYYDLIVVNDGSTDDSLEKLIKEYDLEPGDATFITQPIPTATVSKIYKSKKKQFSRLTVIDKNNGGKSDALNSGINFAKTELVLCTDADCIIEQDALLKLVRPYLEAEEKEIIACGSSIGIANDSVITNGVLTELKLPVNFIPMVQVVKYIRAFLIGRMGWSEVNGLMLVSGAFGMYPRNRMIEVGGFNNNTVGEDLELCIRMRCYMEEQNIPYKLVYLPETLCWTEAPPNRNIFIKQTDRWARGLWEAMSLHKNIFFNKKYHHVGLFYFPYWCIFEFGAPIVEFVGILYILAFSVLGLISWQIAILLFFCVYLMGCLFSTSAIFFYVKNFGYYSKPKQIIELLLAAYLEPFLFHPLMVFGQIKGYYKKIFNIKSGWGVMTRKGFTK